MANDEWRWTLIEKAAAAFLWDQTSPASLKVITGYDFATDYNILFNFYPTILTSK